MNLEEIPSGSLVTLKQEGKEPVDGKIHRIYGHVFIEIYGELYVLDLASRFFFCCHPYVPYTQLPAKGWEILR
jgi:hypothetical protein